MREIRQTFQQILSACVISLGLAPAAQAGEKVTLSLYQGTFVAYPFYVAEHQKLFEKHGLDVEFIYATGLGPVNALASGSVDFAGTSSEIMLTLIDKGQPMKMLAVTTTRPPYTLIVRNTVAMPSQAEGYPAKLKDLRGLKIGAGQPGNMSDLNLRMVLREAGLDAEKDITIVHLGEPAAEVAAYKAGLIDGSMAFEPTQSFLISQGIAKPMLDIQGGDGPMMFREYAFNALWAKQATLERRPDVVRKMIAAIVDAAAIIHDPSKRDETVRIAKQYMPTTDEATLRSYLDRYHTAYNPVATRAALENINQRLLSNKQITKPISYETVVAVDFTPKSFAGKTQ